MKNKKNFANAFIYPVAEKELTEKFWEVAEQFKNLIHPYDLIIARLNKKDKRNKKKEL